MKLKYYRLLLLSMAMILGGAFVFFASGPIDGGHGLLQIEDHSTLRTTNWIKEDQFIRQAYVTFYFSSESKERVLTLMESLRQTGTTADLLVMVLPHITHTERILLCQAGLIVKVIDYFEPPMNSQDTTQIHISILQAWLLNYDRVILLEPELLVLANIDDLFDLNGELLAVKSHNSNPTESTDTSISRFDTGLMVFTPSIQTYSKFLENQNGASIQGVKEFLNQFFKNWTSISTIYNADTLMKKDNLETFPSLDDIKVVRFGEEKPWTLTNVNMNKGNEDSKDSKDKKDDQKEEQIDELKALANIWVSKFKNLESRIQNTQNKQDTAQCVLDSRESYQRKFKLFSPKEEPHAPSFTLDVYPFFHRSNIPLSQTQDITLTTQIDTNRLENILKIVKHWSGPLSVAVYSTNFEKDVLTLSKFIKSYHSEISSVHLHLVHESTYHYSYPINFLRNVALNLSETNLNFILDADFTPPPYMYEKLTKDSKFEFIFKYAPEGHAFVIPAFQIETEDACSTTFGKGSTLCSQDLPTNKEALNILLNKGVSNEFHPEKLGHYFTNTERWRTESKPYYIYWSTWYEPYIIFDKSLPNSPVFEELFYDRSHNKVVFCFELYVRGFRYVVLPDVFVIHRYENEDLNQQVTKKPMKHHASLYKQVELRLRTEFKCKNGKLECSQSPKFSDINPLQLLPSKLSYDGYEEPMLQFV